MKNYIALTFLVIGLFLIISMRLVDYRNNKADQVNPDRNVHRNGAGSAIFL